MISINQVYIVGDIGGTNDDLAAVRIYEGDFEIVFRQERSTKRESDFSKTVNNFLDDLKNEKDLKIDSACFAVAGPVENQRVEMPHANLVIDADRLEKKTDLENVHIINDFDAIGYSINIIDSEDYKVLQAGQENGKQPIAIVGAGTGLGKNLLIHDKYIGSYLPHPSEGGHADLPTTNREELEMVNKIKNEHNIESEVSYEHVLSGQGLENIYSFLQSRYPDEKQNLAASEISRTKNDNPCSRETFEKFIEFYARCCRNYALDTLPENGLYIAGGIAAKNPEEFNQTFIEEFQNTSPQFHKLLSKIPVKVITNYNISLKGAAHALKIKEKGKNK